MIRTQVLAMQRAKFGTDSSLARRRTNLTSIFSSMLQHDHGMFVVYRRELARTRHRFGE